MCGWVAIIAPDSQIEERLLIEMRDRLTHRGPDDSGLWVQEVGEGSVGFGHRRLSIIDITSAGAQPMEFSEAGLVIVFNGEIYNYLELKAELEVRGHTFRNKTDTEVLLHSYAEWGTACLDRFNGMFSFVIWDQFRQRVFAARDRFGEKPLFFGHSTDGSLILASEVKALLAHPKFPAEPDVLQVSRFLSGEKSEHETETLFKGVVQLEPSCALLVSPKGTILQKWRYWELDFNRVQSRYCENSAIEEFSALFERSISLRLRSDVPVGTSLSGGLDSTSIACRLSGLRKNKKIPQNSFSARFDHDPTISEGAEIDLAVARAQVKGHSVTPNPLDLIEENQLLHWHQESPFPSASLYLQWCVMKLAKQHDTKVLLDGQGADELLGGYGKVFPEFQRDQLDRREYVSLLKETFLARKRLKTLAKSYKDPERRFATWIGLSKPEALSYLINQHVLRRGDRKYIGRHLKSTLKTQLDTQLQGLLRYADRSSMAFSREVRLPFLDKDLVEFVSGLPDRALIRNGWQKYILRCSGQGVIPQEIQWRVDKVGFAAPLDNWIRRELKDWAHQMLFKGHHTDLEEFDRASLVETWKDHQAGASDSSWEIWKWISVGEWLSLFRGDAWKVGELGRQ